MRRGTGATSGIPRGDALGIRGLAPLLLASLGERIEGPRPRRLAMPLQMPAVWRQRSHPAPGVAARAVSRALRSVLVDHLRTLANRHPGQGIRDRLVQHAVRKRAHFTSEGPACIPASPGAEGNTSAAAPPAVPGHWPRPSTGPAAEDLRPPPPRHSQAVLCPGLRLTSARCASKGTGRRDKGSPARSDYSCTKRDAPYPRRNAWTRPSRPLGHIPRPRLVRAPAPLLREVEIRSTTRGSRAPESSARRTP